MKISVLTSSRADYSIYLPLLKELKNDPFFQLNIIAFGTHLSVSFGNTIEKIVQDGFTVSKKIEIMANGDHPENISEAIGEMIQKFSQVWKEDDSDIIFALGDRYEMFAACSAAIPFGLKFAHIHGGETTLGAIDEVFRNSISHMSTLHFVTTNKYENKVRALIGNNAQVFNVGALSIDNLKSIKLLTISEFKNKFNIDLSVPTILVTFHPETVNYQNNSKHINELITALEQVNEYQIVFTMPNADTMGLMIRKEIEKFINSNINAIGVESFGTIGYLTCMKHCTFLLGNTSSGFVEASFFPKYVINLGNRQAGRIISDNIFNCEIESNKILKAIEMFKKVKIPKKIELYGNGTTASKIINILKKL